MIKKLLFLALFLFSGCTSTVPLQYTAPVQPPIQEERVLKEDIPQEKSVIETSEYSAPKVTAPKTTSDSVPLSNDNYYTNTDGNTVHSPAYAPAVPVDATAICKDGTYSFSQNRRGTCSHHGGVAEWL